MRKLQKFLPSGKQMLCHAVQRPPHPHSWEPIDVLQCVGPVICQSVQCRLANAHTVCIYMPRIYVCIAVQHYKKPQLCVYLCACLGKFLWESGHYDWHPAPRWQANMYITCLPGKIEGTSPKQYLPDHTALGTFQKKEDWVWMWGLKCEKNGCLSKRFKLSWDRLKRDV